MSLVPKLSALLLAAAAAGASGASLLPELKGALGEKEAKAIESRAGPLQDTLRPIFASMPRNEHGKLGRPVVRYILHRFFMQRGWSVRGLEPAGQAWSEGSPAEMLADGMPKQVADLFEERLSREGLDLQEIAELAAMFKSIVRAEMIERLQAAFRVHSVQRGATLDEETANRVLDTYLASHVVGKNISSMSEWEVHSVETRAAEQYGNWREVQKLARETKRSVLGGSSASLASLKRVAEELGERFGPSENSECQMRKKDLLAIEHRGSGRVRLSDFYRANLHGGKWHFGESSGYLRQLGALDESNPDDLQVIIPNYVNSKSNCIDPSRYYSVCCLNECDALLGQLELKLGSPSATPSQIATLVAATPSATVEGNRTLSASLLQRLQEVADGNNGRVPLHGRLFAQWMHHAYPRECPFPHISGTTSPLRVEDWAAEPGNEVVASREEMLQHVEAPRRAAARRGSQEGEEGECAPWMDDEELLAPHAEGEAGQELEANHGRATFLWSAVGAVGLLAAMMSGAAALRAEGKAPGLCDGKLQAQPAVYYV